MSDLCNDCYRRPGDVVIDEMMGPLPHAGVTEPFRFTYRRCRWCKGVETKRLRRAARMSPTPHQSHEESQRDG